MSVVVIGLNHRFAPLEVLEKVTVADELLPKALADLSTRPNVSEAVVVSTCNRLEVYVYAERFHGAYQDVREFLATWSGLPPEAFASHLYAHYDTDAAQHLFAVTAGLDSAVLGETEIQGQVRDAWEFARVEGTSGATLNAMFRQALEVGKRARTETGISRHITSLSQAAVALADRHLSGLSGQRIVVLGAGEMGEGMATALADAGLADLAFVNRTPARAADLAARLGGRAMGLDGLTDAVTDADALLTSTGATSMLVEEATLAEIMARRAGRPLLVIDLAVPRDIDPAAAELPGVTLLDMDDLRAFADDGRREREAEVERVHEIIDDEVRRYQDLQSARRLAPLITSFRSELEAARQAEFDRFDAKLALLDPVARELVESLTRSMVNKIAHGPTVRLNEAAGTPRGNRLSDAMRELFDL